MWNHDDVRVVQFAERAFWHPAGQCSEERDGDSVHQLCRQLCERGAVS